LPGLITGSLLVAAASAAVSACLSSGCWVTLTVPQCERSGNPAKEPWLTVTVCTSVGAKTSLMVWASGLTITPSTSTAASPVTSAPRRSEAPAIRGRRRTKRGRGCSFAFRLR